MIIYNNKLCPIRRPVSLNDIKRLIKQYHKIYPDKHKQFFKAFIENRVELRDIPNPLLFTLETEKDDIKQILSMGIFYEMFLKS